MTALELAAAARPFVRGMVAEWYSAGLTISGFEDSAGLRHAVMLSLACLVASDRAPLADSIREAAAETRAEGKRIEERRGPGLTIYLGTREAIASLAAVVCAEAARAVLYDASQEREAIVCCVAAENDATSVAILLGVGR